MDTAELQKAFLKRVEDASGKPVIVQCDPNFAGHASIRIAKADQPAHLFQYKPAHSPSLPYLTAFQCLFALRTLEAKPESRFDLASRPSLIPEVLRLVEDHLKNNREVPDHAVPQLANQFANGLGFQLRSMPIAIRIDRQIFENHPGLRTIQRGNVEQQLQENLTALTPRIKKLAPPRLIEANASMSAAFAMFWAGLWNEPAVALPFIAAGYQQAGNDMLALTETIPDDPNNDRQLVDAWMNRLGLQNWFETRKR